MASADLAAILKAKNEAQADIDSFRQGLEGAEKSFMGIPPAAAAAGAAITLSVGAMVALTKAAYDLGAAFDDAFDTIVIKTGATSETLEQLQEDFRAVVAAVPTSFENASTAIGLLNARTGQTGESLQELSIQMLNLSRLTGSDVTENVRTASRVFGDWGISTEEQSGALDKLFRAAQMSGSSVSELSQRIVQFGAPMRQLGLSFDEATSLMAKWEREGVNVETVAGTMRIALAKFAEAGLDPADTFRRLIATIEQMEDPLEATQLAMEVFGKRGGADMAAAIREGRFAIDDYIADLEKAAGAINNTASKTDDAKQQMEKAWNELKVAAEPVVTSVFEAMNSIMTTLTPLVSEFAKNLAEISRLFKEIEQGKVSWAEVAAVLAGGNPNAGRGPAAINPNDLGISITRPSSLAGFGAGDEGPGGEPGAGGGGGGAATLSAEEIAQLRKDNEAAKEAAREAERIRREQEREAARAVKEAERIMEQQRKQAEREAEIEAQRAIALREAGQRRADAINEATDAAAEAIERAQEKTEEQVRVAEENFAREREIAEKREALQKQIAKDMEQAQAEIAGRTLATQQTRDFEDRDRNRAREDEDIAERAAKRKTDLAKEEKALQENVLAARFAGDSRATTAAMLALQKRREAIKDQDDEEVKALAKRRQREDEDYALKLTRQAEDLLAAKTNAETIKTLREELNQPLKDFNDQILKDNLAQRIQEYYKAEKAAVDAANTTLDSRIGRAESQFDQSVERANNIGRSAVSINEFNVINYGVIGEGGAEELMAEAVEAEERLLAQ